MKTELKKLNSCKRELTIEVPKETVDSRFDEASKEVIKRAHIKGFRPGMAPRHIVEAQHGQLIREEALKDLIPDSYSKAIEKEGLFPIELPQISDVQLKEGILSFKAIFEVKPEVKIKNYKGLIVKKKDWKVTDDDIKKTIESIKKSQGLDESAKIDDSFAKGLGYASLKELEDFLKKQLEVSKEQQSRMDVENQLIQQLLKNSELEVPESSVNRQLEHLIHDVKARMSMQGIKKEEIESKENEWREKLKEVAKRDVKIYFILERIAQLESIKSEKENEIIKKVMEFLLKEADWKGGD